MTRKGWQTVALRNEVLQKLMDIYAIDTKRPINQKFNGWLDLLLSEFIDNKEILQRYGGVIDFVDALNNKIVLFDNSINKTVTIFLHNNEKELYCEEHLSDDCIHIGYCFAIPKIYKVLIEYGLKPKEIVSNTIKTAKEYHIRLMRLEERFNEIAKKMGWDKGK